MQPAGKRRKRITIQQLGAGQDTDGSPNGIWSTFAVLWASISPLSGREKLAAQQVDAEVTHSIGILYWPGVVPKMRVQYVDATGTTRLFNIRDVLNVDERNREMIILATEKV